VEAIAADATVTFTEIGWDRTRCTDDLIRQGLQRCPNGHRELDRVPCGFGGFLGDDEWLRHGNLRGVHASPPIAWISIVKGRQPWGDLLALDDRNPGDIRQPAEHHGGFHGAATSISGNRGRTGWAACCR
jgi:hypothetical protein